MAAWVLALLSLAAGPRADAGPSLDERERVAGQVEDFFDQEVCARYKAGVHALPLAVASPSVGLGLDGLALVSSCSVRPIALSPSSPFQARLVWEVEARDAQGQRCVESGEGEAQLTLEAKRWHWDALQMKTHRRVCRPARRFTEVAAAVGLVVPPVGNETFETGALFQGGLAVRDFDGDGKPDVIAVTARQAYLFHNEGERFSRTPLGPPSPPGSTYAMPVVGDFDGDGWPDVVLLARGEASSNLVFRNAGGALQLAGRLPLGGAFQAGVATDLDGDGHLDLVVLGYPVGPAVDDGLEATNGEVPHFLFGDGKLGFTERPLPPDLQRRRYGLAAIAADITGRGRQEIYVANDYGSHDLWWLDDAGHFHESAGAVGLLDPGNGMSADLGDIDSSGRASLYVANMFSKAGERVIQAAPVDEALRRRLEKFAHGNTLYSPLPDGGFAEHAEALGINRGLWAFGSIFADYDNDGRLDVAVADGFLSQPRRKDL